MEVYIGMDISLQETQVCAVDGEGKIVHEGKAASEPEALRRYFLEHGKAWQIKRIGFETGQLSSHIYHGLHGAGLPVVCMDARHAHGVLKAYGIKLGAVTQNGFRQKVEEAVSSQDALIRQSTEALLEARAGLLGKEKELDRQCRKMTRGDAVCKRLVSIPGIGPITALSYKAEIDDPARFMKSRDIGVHLGLTPRRYASGEIDRSGRISKCGNRALRSLLFEAAVVMLTRSKKWSRLRNWGVQIAKRSSFKTAATAVARKLAIVMHRLWVEEKEFAYGAP